MNEVEGNLAYMPTGYEPATPSRSRTTPSGSVAWATELLEDLHFPLHSALDLGCGRGRNSLYLARKGAHVTAMDFTPQAIGFLQKTAERLKVSDKIRAIVQDITEDWPIEPHSIDLAVDSFCFKHLDSLEACRAYKENLLRILRARGHYLISLSSIGDGYYGRYMRRRDQATMPADDSVEIDPVNGVESPIYSRKKIIAFFSPELEVREELKNDDAESRLKDDGTYALLFKRSPKWFYS